MSYPSGHAAGSMVVLLTAALMMGERRLRWAAVALSLAIGTTRPMLGMHWPSDVIGGWMWGASFALLGTGVATQLGLPRGARA
jgi:undecaprenyl-diphosphatase